MLAKDNPSQIKKQFLNEFFFFLEKVIQTVWKIYCPLYLIFHAILGSKNCNQEFAMIGNEWFASLWRNFEPPFFA